jgi:hypothetical protein
MERPDVDELAPPTWSAKKDFFFHAGELRTFWRLALFTGIYLPSLFGVMLLIQLAPAFPQVPMTYMVGQHLISFLVTWVVLRLVERKPFVSVGLAPTSAGIRQAGFGLLSGAAMICAVVALQIGSGVAVWKIGVPTVGAAVSWLGEGAVYFIVVGFGEELLFRGYCFQAVIRGTNAGVAIVLSSLAFSLMHIWNPHITIFSLANVGLAGALFGLAYVRSGALWLPAGMHIAWNFFQGPLFGFPVSGIPARSILLASDRGPQWLSGGAFGPEGGAMVTMVLAAGILFFLRRDAYGRWMPEKMTTPTNQESGSDHA